MAQRPQRHRPQLLVDLVQPIQDHRDLPGCDKPGGFLDAALTCQQRVHLLEQNGKPVLEALPARVPPL